MAASRSCRITCRCSDSQLLAHAPLLGHLRGDRLLRFAQLVEHVDERLLQLLHLQRRHRASAAAASRSPEATRSAVRPTRAIEAPHEYERQQTNWSDEREDRDAEADGDVAR